MRIAISLVLLLSISRLIGQEERERIRYVAIGDSYSIGEGASPDECWPAVLTRDLKKQGVAIALVANPSRTGWTTQDAIDQELPVFLSAKPNFATLQIGVNDWVRGVDLETFRQGFVFLLEKMLGALPGKDRLLVVNIPDFGVTPTGGRYSGGRNISEGIAAFNRVIAEETNKRSLRVVDIFELSRKMKNHPSLIAADGLHPSAKEYAEWEKVILPAAAALLKK